MRFVFIFSLIFVLTASNVLAAELIIQNQTPAYLHEDVAVDILLNTDGEAINALEGQLSITGDKFYVSDIHLGNSVVNFWPIKPTVLTPNPQGDVSIQFAGIITGGFHGINGPTNTQTSGTVMTLILRPINAGQLTITASDLSVLKHDGKGSEAETTTKPLSIKVNTNDSKPDESTQRLLALDETPPEIMSASIVTEEYLFNGEPTLIVDARDGETGILYIEIKKDSASEFTRIKSPHNITPIKLNESVVIKVTDKAGNVTQTSLTFTPEPELTSKHSQFARLGMIPITILVLFLSLIMLRIARVRKE